MPGRVTGKDAKVWIGCTNLGTKTHELWAISDFSLTIDRGTVEQDLIGQPGNYVTQGAMSIEGSLTNCRFAASGNADMLRNIVEQSGNYQYLQVSGQIGSTNGLKFYFVSCQVTGYEILIGDASTISEASIDFQVLDANNVTYSNGLITDAA